MTCPGLLVRSYKVIFDWPLPLLDLEACVGGLAVNWVWLSPVLGLGKLSKRLWAPQGLFATCWLPMSLSHWKRIFRCTGNICLPSIQSSPWNVALAGQGGFPKSNGVWVLVFTNLISTQFLCQCLPCNQFANTVGMLQPTTTHVWPIDLWELPMRACNTSCD